MRSDQGTESDGPEADPYRLFVGRERELEALVRAFEDARGGRGSLFLLAGEPGVGKTRLADELARRAAEADATVLWGRCWEAGGAPAFWPWVQAIRSYGRTVDSETLERQLGAGAPFIAQTVPELRQVVSGIDEPPLLEADVARFRLFDAATAFLVAAARERPLVLLFDDLQSADEPSLLLLQFVARELTAAHILIVATYRDIDVSWSQPFLSTLAELNRAAATRRLDLRGLGEEAVGLFIEAITGTAPSSPVLAAIHRRTEGNPLFVAEVARLLASEGRLTQSELGRLAIPEGIREVIRRRFERLSSACVETLTAASVFGRDFAVEVLRMLSGASREDLSEVLEEGVRARVLTPVPGQSGKFRFFHGLVRDSLYDIVPAPRRIELHREIGESLESLYREDPEPHLAELAYHFIEAAPGGDVSKAIDYAKRAGVRASRLLAFEEAVRLFRMGLQAQELTESPDEWDRCDLLVELGDAQARAGDAVIAAETFLRAARLAKRLELPDHLGRAALGYGGRFVWTRGSITPHLVPLLRDALAALPEDDSSLRARLMARLSCALRDEVDKRPRTELAGEAVAMARRLGDQATLAYALGGQYAAVYGPENAELRLAIAEELIRVAETIGDKERATDGHIYRLWPLLELGDMPSAFQELEAAARVARELGQPAQMWVIAVTRSTLALFEGRWEEAEELIHEGRRSGERAEWQASASYVTQTFALRKEHGGRAAAVRAPRRSLPTQTFALRKERGGLEEWRGSTERAANEYPTRPMFRCLLANLCVELGDRAAASRIFESLATDEFAGIPRDTEWLLSMSLLVEVADFLGDRRRARVLYDFLRPFDGLNVLDANEFCAGAVARYLGIAASVEPRWDEAAGHFEDALEMNERTGGRPWLAHTQHDYARMLVARDGPGDRDRALELVDAALRTARDIGMVALEHKLTRLRGGLGGEPLVEESVAPLSSGGPTVFRREGEYWSIAFEGDAFRLKDTKGLRYLGHLLANPGREVHAIDLVMAGEGGPARIGGTATRLDKSGVDASVSGDAGEVLDPQARTAYRRRLEELREDLEEAESFGDAERAARAREEMDFLARELAGAVGLGGRDRKAASGAERARQSVTKAIKAALDRINAHSPALAGHLASAVETGTFCAYVPDPRAPISWNLSS